MATFRILTPLRTGEAAHHPPHAIVEISDTDAAPLLLCGAIEVTDDQDDQAMAETSEAKAAREEQERVDAEYEQQLVEYNAKESAKAAAKSSHKE